MDTIWPVIIVIVLFAVLPDLLRKKRKYPTRGKKGPIPIPKRRKQGEVHGPIVTPKQKAPQPAPPSAKQPLPQTNRPVPKPVPSQQPEPVPQPKKQTYRKPQTAVNPQAVPASAATVTHLVQPEAWSGLHDEARDIYAGLVWAELLQPPVALRQNQRNR
jgi:hypothetical protein